MTRRRNDNALDSGLSRRKFVHALAGGGLVLAAGNRVGAQEHEQLFHPEWLNNIKLDHILDGADSGYIGPLANGGTPDWMLAFNHYMGFTMEMRAAGMDALMNRCAQYPESWSQLEAIGPNWDFLNQGVSQYFSPNSRNQILDAVALGLNRIHGRKAEMLSGIQRMGFATLHSGGAGAINDAGYHWHGLTPCPPIFPPVWDWNEGWLWYDPWSSYTPQPLVAMSKEDFCTWSGWIMDYISGVLLVLSRGPGWGWESVIGLGNPGGAVIGPGLGLGGAVVFGGGVVISGKAVIIIAASTFLLGKILKIYC